MASGYMFSHYWPGDGVEGEGPDAVYSSNYPYWFDGSTLGMNFVPFRLPVPRQRYWFEKVGKRFARYRHRAWTWVPRRLQVWIQATRLIFSSGFGSARAAVDAVCVDPSTRSVGSWNTALATRIGQDPHVHENVYRFLAAYDRMPSRLSRVDRSVLVELAYLGRKNG